MKVCFSVGNASNNLIKVLKNSVDNVEFYSYLSIQSMVRESTMRHIFFDRIIFSEKIIQNAEGEFLALYNYLSEYSDKTSVILICQSEESEMIEAFCNVFNSPQYTVAVSPSATINMLSEFVKGDIRSIKQKYFKGDTKQVKTVISKHAESTVSVAAEPEEKKGIFKKIFSGKKKIDSKIENQKVEEESSVSQGKADKTVSNNNEDRGIGKFISDVGDTGLSGANALEVKNDLKENQTFRDIAPEYHQASLLGGSDLSKNEELEELGISDFGKKHIDTDFFDEEEEELEVGLREDLGNKSDIKLVPDMEKVVIFTGDRGVGVTSFIVDTAVSLQSKGNKVLIINLDYMRSGILSYINTENFKNMYGIREFRVYEEDGIHILSNGYNCPLISEDIRVVEDLVVSSIYDNILIDCPLDCISVLTAKMIKNSKVRVLVAGNRGSIISTLSGLTSSSLSIFIQDELFYNSEFLVINKIDEYFQDLSFLSNYLLFSRYNWLEKLE